MYFYHIYLLTANCQWVFVLLLALSKETSTISLVFQILLILQGLVQIISPHPSESLSPDQARKSSVSSPKLPKY